MKAGTQRLLFFSLAWLSLGLGILGIFLPILPTTPFAILSAWLFSKSSERWHQWLLQHKILGPTIHDWERDGVIKLKSKIIATSMIILFFSYTLIFVQIVVTLKYFISFIGCAVLIFIWTRPSQAIS